MYQSWMVRSSARLCCDAAHHILVDPADAGRVGAEAWGHARRQAPRGGAQIFEHARARPIEIGAVLEDHVDEGHAEEGEAAHHARFRHGQHRRGQRIGDLVLDHLRRLAGILGVDDDLHVGEVGDGIERHARDRVDAGERHEDRGKPDQKDVAGRPADDGGDHGCVSCWLKLCSAALQIALGVDEEIGRGDDLLADLQAVHDLDIALAAPAKLHRARLEAALALGHEHDLARAAVDHRAVGDGGRPALPSPASNTTSAYIEVLSCPSGLGSSMRTGTVRVSGFSSG